MKNPISFFFICISSFPNTNFWAKDTVFIVWFWHPHTRPFDHIQEGLFWCLCSLPLVYNSVFIQVPYWFDYYNFVAWFETRNCGLQPCSFFKIVLTIPGPLRCHMNFRMEFSTYAKKNTSGILIGVTFNSEVALGSTNILRISGPPVYEHRITICFYLP